MNNLIIKSKNSKGKSALKKGLEESSLVQKKLVKQWYEIKKVREHPYTLMIGVKLPLLSLAIVEAQLEDILTVNGAERDKDYVISRSGVVK